jgi:hypothetical protein
VDDAGRFWWERVCWEEAVLEAAEGKPATLVARLLSTAPITQWDREILAWLHEKRRFRPEPEPNERDEALASAAREVRALRAIQKKGPNAPQKFQELASLSGGTLSIFKNGTLNPLVSVAYAGTWSEDDNVMLLAPPHIQRNLHKMSKDQIVEGVAEYRGVSEEALHDFLGGRGRSYRRYRGRR